MHVAQHKARGHCYLESPGFGAKDSLEHVTNVTTSLQSLSEPIDASESETSCQYSTDDNPLASQRASQRDRFVNRRASRR